MENIYTVLTQHVKVIINENIDKLLNTPLFAGADLEFATAEQQAALTKMLNSFVKDVHAYSLVHYKEFLSIYWIDSSSFQQMLDVINANCSMYSIKNKMVYQLGKRLSNPEIFGIFLCYVYYEEHLKFAHERIAELSAVLK